MMLVMSDDFRQLLVNERGPTLDDIGGGLRGPEYFRVQVFLESRPDIDVGIRITLIDGAYVVTELSASSTTKKEITAEFLRLLPLRWIVRTMARREIGNLNVDRAFDLRGGGNFGTEEAKLRYTAFVYRLARALGDAPVKAVMEADGVSRSTASRSVAAARKAGYLRPDETGQAGGARSRLGG
jgi:hypothetical protein